MKSIFNLILITLLSSTVNAQSLKNQIDSLSYALGQDMGNSLKNSEVQVNKEVLLASLADALLGKSSLFTQESSKEIIQTAMQKAHEDKVAKTNQINEDFLKTNLKKQGVQSTVEGLQYVVLVQGEGPNPKINDEIEVHYVGTLINGEKFDSTYDRQETLVFALDRMIEGWKIGIPLMKVGSKYRFFIPSNLAYGERSMSKIPAHSILIFDVELISIKTKENQAQ